MACLTLSWKKIQLFVPYCLYTIQVQIQPTWNAWGKSPLAYLKLSTAPCLVSSTAWASACTSTWSQIQNNHWKQLGSGKKNHLKIKQLLSTLTSSKGGASYKLSCGLAAGSRSSKSNLSVRSEMGDEIPWRKQNPLCMLPNIKEYIAYKTLWGERRKIEHGKIIWIDIPY